MIKMVEEKKKINEELGKKKEKVEITGKPTKPSPSHPPRKETKGRGIENKTENNEGKIKKSEEIIEQPKEQFNPHQIIEYPLSTEKSIRQIEFDNKLAFVVHSQATKKDVKRAVEELFKVKVVGVNIQNSFTGEKRAYVKLSAESLAADVSADLGLI